MMFNDEHDKLLFLKFSFILFTRKQTFSNQKYYSALISLSPQTTCSQLLHTPTDLRAQLIYHRCCCVQVLYIPGGGGSAQTLNYMGAKAIKTEISG